MKIKLMILTGLLVLSGAASALSPEIAKFNNAPRCDSGDKEITHWRVRYLKMTGQDVKKHYQSCNPTTGQCVDCERTDSD